MRYLIILLLCVPLQLTLTIYRLPIERFFVDTTKFWYSKVEEYFTNKTDGTSVKALYTGYQEDELEKEFKMNRPENLKYRVGQVAVNITYRYMGLIIGWRIRKDDPKNPVYEILTNHPTVDDFKTTATQDELVVIENIQLYHPESEKYFSEFDEYKSQYMPQPWLRILYPTD